MSALIAERELGCVGGRASIRIFAPQPDRGDWRCDYEISWPSRPRTSFAMGVDSFQALKLVVEKIGVDVAASDEFKSGRMTLFGEPMTTTAHLKEMFATPRGFAE